MSMGYPWHPWAGLAPHIWMSPCWTPWWVGGSVDEYHPYYMASFPPPFPHFLFVQGTDPEKPLSKLSPFAIKKSIESIAGPPKKVTQLRSGCIIIEIDKQSHATNLLQANKFLNTPVKIAPHRSLNSSKGVIRCRELRDCSEQEIIDGLEDQNVVAAHKVTITKNDTKTPTNTIFLTFNSPKIPSAIQVGYLNVKVEPYIPNPIRCFSCQKFGHLSKNCQKPPVCANCGSTEHSFEFCAQPSKCLNCEGTHPSSSKQCPKWINEKNIQKTKVTMNIPYHEAKAICHPNQPSYSTITTRKTTTTIGTQTEIPRTILKDSMTTSSTQTQTISSSQSISSNKNNSKSQNSRNSTSRLPISKSASNPKPSNNTGRRRKGEDDQIRLHNKFAVLEGEETGDDMEIAAGQLSPSCPSSPMRKKTKSSRSPVKGP